MIEIFHEYSWKMYKTLIRLVWERNISWTNGREKAFVSNMITWQVWLRGTLHHSGIIKTTSWLQYKPATEKLNVAKPGCLASYRLRRNRWRIWNIARNIRNTANEQMDYWSFSSDTQQSNTSERKRNKNLSDYIPRCESK